ncbi:hypothetical protein E2C01_058256 [Portunus trituberculatus]|uniref:Uncharacterized protein n=1 Tax=Portunus trituberculatus TaxID=210409 RepID=A0A5B7H5K4_PORTR|nr:hypothetical protein [Portunus trituberculatus]
MCYALTGTSPYPPTMKDPHSQTGVAGSLVRGHNVCCSRDGVAVLPLQLLSLPGARSIASFAVSEV